MPGWGCVDQDMTVQPASYNPAEMQECDHFVNPRDRQAQEFTYFWLAEKGAAFQDFSEHSPILLLEFLECRCGVQFTGIQTCPSMSRDDAGLAPDPSSNAICERVSWICRKQINSL